MCVMMLLLLARSGLEYQGIAMHFIIKLFHSILSICFTCIQLVEHEVTRIHPFKKPAQDCGAYCFNRNTCN
ncbi:hypothetical protein Leryth_000221 [Lithospermum erythrorhizon]|nr:hypothetical protein Leryth_000221 [Lithospermum erythrorhizon]